eukprot:Polyplicarium_translucidae@DN2764_c0_g1_i8.p5
MSVGSAPHPAIATAAKMGRCIRHRAVQCKLIGKDRERDGGQRAGGPPRHHAPPVVQTCVARCWDFDKPILIAPAMNTAMWNHPLTAAQIATVKDLGYKVGVNPCPCPNRVPIPIVPLPCQNPHRVPIPTVSRCRSLVPSARR